MLSSQRLWPAWCSFWVGFTASPMVARAVWGASRAVTAASRDPASRRGPPPARVGGGRPGRPRRVGLHRRRRVEQRLHDPPLLLDPLLARGAAVAAIAAVSSTS